MSRFARDKASPWWGLAVRGLVLSVALAFLARGVSWHDIAHTLGRAGVVLPLIMIVINACMMGLRALRLRILLQKRVSFASSFVTLLTSSALNNITPFRGGQVARLWMIERASGMTKSSALAVTLVESLVEIVVLSLLGFGASWFVVGQRWAVVAAPVAFIATVAVLLVLRARSRRAADSPAPTPSTGTARSGRLRRLLARLQPGFHALSVPGATARALVLSLLAWLCEAAMLLLCGKCIGLPISFPLAILVILGLNLALTLPSTPASAGPFEGATVAVLMLAGAAKGPAVALAFFYHAIQVVPVTVAGAAVLLLARRRQRRLTGHSELGTETPSTNDRQPMARSPAVL